MPFLCLRSIPLAAILLPCALLVTARMSAGPPPELRAGAAAVPFQCEDDLVIAGGIGPGKATGQEGRLGASATVLQLGEARAAIVACDILMMRRDYLDAAAERIEKALGIPAANVLINATHTHHAPSTVTIHGYARSEEFCAQVRDAIVAAVASAAGRLREGPPVELVFCLGHESSVGENSRILLADETIFWVGKRDDAVRPTGPFDPALPVLGLRRPDGSFESVIFNHSTHAIGTSTPGARSPTFYGLAAQRLESDTKGVVSFLSGAYGSTHNLRLDNAEMTLRIETALRRALAQATPRAVGRLLARKRPFRYRVRQFDEEVEDRAVETYCRKRLGGDPQYVIDTFRTMRKALAAVQGEERVTWLQALLIGDVAIVAVPGELFTVLGLEIKRRSPFRYTYIAGTANDYIGYIPDAEAYALGGYQVWTGYHSHVARGTGEAIVDAAVDLLDELHRTQ